MSGEALAIIPVRGGSVGIPRKNARLLRGKPLLAYVIETARHSEEIATVVVSTEDPELAEIARRFGAEVVERPGGLAGPEVTLDDVIVDAVAQLEARGRRFEHVVTLQATSPLLRAVTIDRAVSQCRERGDVVRREKKSAGASAPLSRNWWRGGLSARGAATRYAIW